MSRYIGPRLRITRRLGNLIGLTRKQPPLKPLFTNRPSGKRAIIPPGQHGRAKLAKKKPYESNEYDYLIRLKFKQRLRYYYGITERQLFNYVKFARKSPGSTGRVLLRLLEMRLDNIVFRLHMAPTIRAARQLISHGHINVNKFKVTLPSYQCKPKDFITVAPKIRSLELVNNFINEFDNEKARCKRLMEIIKKGPTSFNKGKTRQNSQTNRFSSSSFSKQTLSGFDLNKSNKTENVAQLALRANQGGGFDTSNTSLKLHNIYKVKIQTKIYESKGTIAGLLKKDGQAIGFAKKQMVLIQPIFLNTLTKNNISSKQNYKKMQIYIYSATRYKTKKLMLRSNSFNKKRCAPKIIYLGYPIKPITVDISLCSPFLNGLDLILFFNTLKKNTPPSVLFKNITNISAALRTNKLNIKKQPFNRFTNSNVSRNNSAAQIKKDSLRKTEGYISPNAMGGSSMRFPSKTTFGKNVGQTQKNNVQFLKKKNWQVFIKKSALIILGLKTPLNLML
jgi:small subunit ribosomal protein S4